MAAAVQPGTLHQVQNPRPIAAAALCLLLSAACAHPGVLAGPKAAQTPVAAPAPAAASSDDHPDEYADDEAPEPQANAETLLGEGFAALRAQRPAAASYALRAALATQDLSDAGRALAYWHIYVAEQAMGAQGHANAALADFIAVGDTVLSSTEPQNRANTRAFAEHFDLQGRLARGRATQSLAWSRLTPGFGHSKAIPVPVSSEAELHHFIALAPPCAGASHRVVTQGRAGRDELGHPISQVTLSCAGAAAPVHYFFKLAHQ